MSGPRVNLSGWLLSIPTSLALHAVPLAMFLRLFTPPLEDVFLVDLTDRPETAQVQPRRTDSARRLDAPSSPRNPAQTSARPEALAPESMPRLPEPSPPQPPRESAATVITPAPSPPMAAPEPMPQVAEPPPRQPEPTITAVSPSPPSVSVEADLPAPVGPAPSATTMRPTSTAAKEAEPPAATARVGPHESAGAGNARQPDARRSAATSGSSASESTEAEYRAYLALVRQRILQTLQYPRSARQQGLIGTVHIEIVVQPTGAISDVKIVSPSSHPILDRAALETVRSLPSIGFPPGLVPRQLRARLPVVFSLR